MRRYTNPRSSLVKKVTSSSSSFGWFPKELGFYSGLWSDKKSSRFQLPCWMMHQSPRFRFTPLYAFYGLGAAFSLYAIKEQYHRYVFSSLFGVLPRAVLLPSLEKDPFSTTPNISFSRQLNDTEMFALEKMLRLFYPNSKPSMFTISEMQSWAEPASEWEQKTKDAGESLAYYILEGVDSAVAPHLRAMANGIRQLASQFSLGEDPNKDTPTHPSNFKYDHTQGPAEQAASVVAALLRWIHRAECDGMANLLRYPEFTQLFDYQNGYLTPKLDCEKKALAFLEAHVDEIQLNVQRVRVDGSDHSVLQVLTAAPALGAYDTYAAKRSEAGNEACFNISKVLMIAQYKALAGVAVKEARQNKMSGERTPIVLTPLGGGVFGNCPEAIKAGVHAFCEAVKQSGETTIDVCLSAYQEGEADLYRTKHFNGAPTISESALSGLNRLSDFSCSPGLHQTF